MNKIFVIRDDSLRGDYTHKFSWLIKLINKIVIEDEFDAIQVSSQLSLGDNELELQESLRRISQADLKLQIGRELYLTSWDIRNIKWSGK